MDSHVFTAMKRKRYFWGNIPGLADLTRLRDSAKKVELSDVLMPNRTANVSTVLMQNSPAIVNLFCLIFSL